MATLFFSYSHKDEALRDRLEVHLSMFKREGLIDAWYDRKISAGDQFDRTIDENLEKANIILLLVSADFLASRYCFDVEVQQAMHRHDEGSARVIPVILRPCDWLHAPFGKLLAAPTNGKAITQWENRDQAFLTVIEQIRQALVDDRTRGPNMNKAILPDSVPNRGLGSHYRSLPERLARIGVVPTDSLRDSTLLQRLGNPLVVDGMVLRGNLAGFQGVPPEKVRSQSILESRPLPDYILEKKKQIPEPEVNRKKAFLAGWMGPVPDQGGFLDLSFGITDFWTNLAIDTSIERIRRELRDGTIDFRTWPGEAYCDIIVISGDGQLLLCQRASHLYHEPLKWSASLEESLDAEEDLQSGVLDPSFTVRRALIEELGLPSEKIGTADIRFVAIATDWKNLASAFVIIVRLGQMSAPEIRDYWRAQASHEQVECDPVPLSMENGLKLLSEGPITLARSAKEGAAFHRTARMRILISLFHEFGYDAVLSALF